MRPRPAGWALAVLATAAVAGLSRAPLRFAREDQAVVRLSWRIQPRTVEACRELGEAEARSLPAHMRAPRVCEGRGISYRLRVAVDGVPALDEEIAPGGARGDRPVTVFRELPATPGAHRLEVAFEGIDPAGGVPLDPMRLARTVALSGRDVALVTLDPAGSGLVVRGPADPPELEDR